MDWNDTRCRRVLVFELTDLIELSVGTENKGEDMKNLDPNHTASLIPFRKTEKERKVLDRAEMEQDWD